MASVYQKRETWYVAYRHADGTRKAVPTKARTKGEAKALAQELESKAWRVEHGLEAGPTGTRTTLWELCSWWLDERCPAASQERERNRLRRHVERTPLGNLLLPAVTAERIEDYLRALEKAGGSPASCNHLRAKLRAVFARAILDKRWGSANPLLGVSHRKVPKKQHTTLSSEEVPLVLRHTKQPWRDLIATALYTGMRKGELLGLRKESVDLQDRTILVERSYDRETTKGGHADTIPIADPLVPYLEHAIETAKGELVFPLPSGKMRGEDTKVERVLRTALGAAGLVTGYKHHCRRCRRAWRFQDATQRRCPDCTMLLWVVPVPRHMTFHELRHTTGTLMLKAGIDLHRVQRVLRHSDPKVTAGTYAHLQVEDLRVAVAAIGGGSIDSQSLPGIATASCPAPNSPVVPECARPGSNGQPTASKAPGGGVRMAPDSTEDAEIIPFWTPVQDEDFRPKPKLSGKTTDIPLPEKLPYSLPAVVSRPGFWLRARTS